VDLWRAVNGVEGRGWEGWVRGEGGDGRVSA